MTSSTPSSDRQKVGFDLRVPLGELEAIRPDVLPTVLGTIIGDVIANVLGEPGVELDTLNVLVTPEASLPPVAGSFGEHGEQMPDVLHVRAWVERDRPEEPAEGDDGEPLLA